ncbi:MAG: alpha/beta hydrolase [Planctomycetota bacterium]|nr:MAG: alpha/beta hydrolase [Planctomycetota bacterium]
MKNLRTCQVGVIVYCYIFCFSCSAVEKQKQQPAPVKIPQVILLWPEGAPGAVGNEDQDQPTLSVYLPPKEKANKTSVIVYPGGGYRKLSMDHEGRQVAEWLNSFGVTAFVLKYRLLPRYKYPAPLDDAKRAMRIVRSRADEWNVDPQGIGILGFSAGGHLVSAIGTHFDYGKPDAKDRIERAGCRPDFMVIVYPCISLSLQNKSRPGRRSLLGDDPKLVEEYSSDRHVTSETPPTFLMHAGNDRTVIPDHSIVFYQALRKAGVPAEMHIYERAKRGHGFGLAPNDPLVSSWPKLCEDWMRGRGLLNKD